MVDRWILGLLVDHLVSETVDRAGQMRDEQSRSQVMALSKDVVLNTLDRLAVERDCYWVLNAAAGRAILAGWLGRTGF